MPGCAPLDRDENTAAAMPGYLGVLLATSRERLSAAVRIHPVGAEGRTVRLERAHMRSHLMQIAPAELAFGALLNDPVSRAPRI